MERFSTHTRVYMLYIQEVCVCVLVSCTLSAVLFFSVCYDFTTNQILNLIWTPSRRHWLWHWLILWQQKNKCFTRHWSGQRLRRNRSLLDCHHTSVSTRSQRGYESVWFDETACWTLLLFNIMWSNSLPECDEQADSSPVLRLMLKTCPVPNE